MKQANKYFSNTDLERISTAVKEAEGKTSGEIVPFFVPQSDDYEEAIWRAAVVFGALPLVLLAALRLFSEYWFLGGILGVSLSFLSACIFGAFLARFAPPVKRFFAGRDLLRHRVSQRANEAFLSEEVFKTRDRTGILIFLSFLERSVVVLGDSGINAKVQPGEWDSVVDTIVAGMKGGNPAEGLIRAIGQCGELLRRRGIWKKRGDTNELANRLRVKKK